ncbi:hypothetical protein RRG08_028237 [Elysia crispata]|uniref:Uncharacterized protein n=1 Tax=Elysia crispata TaxID=231223 RepID=A0AAE0YFG6_9GAST|nr:hypothetical protein RRG08_028237 [Elysia crispata]
MSKITLREGWHYSKADLAGVNTYTTQNGENFLWILCGLELTLPQQLQISVQQNVVQWSVDPFVMPSRVEVLPDGSLEKAPRVGAWGAELVLRQVIYDKHSPECSASSPLQSWLV